MDTMIDHDELLIREAAYSQCIWCHSGDPDEPGDPDELCSQCPLQAFTRFGQAPEGSLLDAVKMFCRTLCGNAKNARGDCTVDECKIYQYEGWKYYITES
jgi:hypothetical protein